MVTLRSRDINTSIGFSTAEIEKMESLLKEPDEQPLDREFYIRLTKHFNSCKDRAGKPALKWAEVENWFRNRQKSNRLKKKSLVKSAEKLSTVPEACSNKELKLCSTSKAEGKVPDVSELEFEARSAKDGAWYDVEICLSCRFSEDYEVLVRFVGFGPEHDEWLNVKRDIRERSQPLDDSECGKLKIGDHIVCFQECEEMARYFDAHIVDIQRKMHDVRGCRCLFLIRYNHDNTKEKVQLSRLCCRPSY